MLNVNYETWFTEIINNNRVTFKVFRSGAFVIQSIYRDGKNVTSSLTINRYCKDMIRFWVANKMIQY
jgi:hypothetical protein